MNTQEIINLIDLEVKKMKSKNKGEWYGAGLPVCERSCDECQGRAEDWAEKIGCTIDEIWEAVNF